MKAALLNLLEKMEEENVQGAMTWVHDSEMSCMEADKPYAFVFSQVLFITLMFLHFECNLLKITQSGHFKII